MRAITLGAHTPRPEGGTLCRDVPTWSIPTLPGGANFVSPSEWLQVSRAYWRGNDMFHLACCQMKHLRNVCTSAYVLVSAWARFHSRPLGAPPFPAPQGALYVSHPDGDTKFAPWRKPGGCPPPHLRLRESRRMAGRMSTKPPLPRAALPRRLKDRRGRAARIFQIVNCKSSIVNSLDFPLRSGKLAAPRTDSSVVERLFYTQLVGGSNPSPCIQPEPQDISLRLFSVFITA